MESIPYSELIKRGCVNRNNQHYFRFNEHVVMTLWFHISSLGVESVQENTLKAYWPDKFVVTQFLHKVTNFCT
jgi:hypothetical protein